MRAHERTSVTRRGLLWATIFLSVGGAMAPWWPPQPAAAQRESSGAPSLRSSVGYSREGSEVSVAIGPNGLLAVATSDRVYLWDAAGRRFLDELSFTPDPPNRPGMPTRIDRVGFTLDGRLLLSASGRTDVIDLRDARQRQLLPHGFAAFSATTDGVLVAVSPGVVVRYAGRPLVERERLRLPDGAWPVSSLLQSDGRVFATAGSRLFASDGGSLREVQLPPVAGRTTELRAAVGRRGELVVADTRRLLRLATATWTVLAEVTTAAAETQRLNVGCSPATQLCYWTRGHRVEVWRDDLSAAVGTPELRGLLALDTQTGRVVRRADTLRQSSPPRPTIPLFEVAEAWDGAFQPMGAQVLSPKVTFSSRSDELLVELLDVYRLHVNDLSLQRLAETQGPVAVAADGRVVTSGPVGEVVVFSPALAEERRIYPQGCNASRIPGLERRDTEAAWAAVDAIVTTCRASAPNMLWAAPAGTLVALDGPVGTLRFLDIARGRWLDRFVDFADRGEDTEVRGVAWWSRGDTLEAFVGTQAYQVQRGRRGVASRVVDSGVTAFAYDSSATRAEATRTGELRLGTGATAVTVVLGFEATTLVPGPADQWVALGETDVAWIEGGRVRARHTIPTRTALGASSASWAGGAPVVAFTRDGQAAVVRVSDGQRLTLTFGRGDERPFVMAEAGGRFYAPPHARSLVYARANAHDLLAPSIALDGLLDEQLVARFLSGR